MLIVLIGLFMIFFTVLWLVAWVFHLIWTFDNNAEWDWGTMSTFHKIVEDQCARYNAEGSVQRPYYERNYIYDYSVYDDREFYPEVRSLIICKQDYVSFIDPIDSSSKGMLFNPISYLSYRIWFYNKTKKSRRRRGLWTED